MKINDRKKINNDIIHAKEQKIEFLKMPVSNENQDYKEKTWFTKNLHALKNRNEASLMLNNTRKNDA